MTEPKHTKEPWAYVERVSGSENHKGYRIYDPDKWYVAEVYPIDEDGIKGKELARRIVACVNALEGVPTEVLEGLNLKDFLTRIHDLMEAAHGNTDIAYPPDQEDSDIEQHDPLWLAIRDLRRLV